MVDPAFLPDFSEFYRKDGLSDVTVVLCEDEAAVCTSSRSGQKRQAAQMEAPQADEDQGSLQRTSVPGHSMVLVAFSTFLKAKLESWSEGRFQSQTSGCQSRQDSLSWESGCCRQCTSLSLHWRPSARPSCCSCLSWQTDTAPTRCSSQQWQCCRRYCKQTCSGRQCLVCMACHPAALMPARHPAMQQQLRQQLGDLELALSDSQKRQRLLVLPHKALLLLLQDGKTKVAAENTVFRAIEAWHGHQQQHCSGPSDAEMMQLLRLIRMQHCTQPFVATVLSESPLAAKCFSAIDLRMACICSNAGGAPAKELVAGMLAVKHPTNVKFAAWQLPQRPASAMTQLSMQREVSLEELKLELQAMQVGSGASHRFTLFEAQSWQGEQFIVQMGLARGVQLEGGKDKDKDTDRTDSKLICSGPFKVGLYIGVKGGGSNLLRLLSCKLTVSSSFQPVTQAFGFRPSFTSSNQVLTMSKAGVNCSPIGWPDFLGYGNVDSWAVLEAKMRASNLVHAGSCLQIKVDVTELL